MRNSGPGQASSSPHVPAPSSYVFYASTASVASSRPPLFARTISPQRIPSPQHARADEPAPAPPSLSRVHVHAHGTTNTHHTHPHLTHRPVLERAGSSASSTSSAIPHIASGLPLWTRYDLFVSSNQPASSLSSSSAFAAASSSSSSSSVFNPIGSLIAPPTDTTPTDDGSSPGSTSTFSSSASSPWTSFFDPATMPVSALDGDVATSSSAAAALHKQSLAAAVAGNDGADGVDSDECARPVCTATVTSPPMPLPLESASDLIHTRRVLSTSYSSYLRSGARFMGTQQSGRQTYEVHVELKHVDMADSFVCGYLYIKGLTEDHPTLTTYFEGQMIGPKYSFLTRRRDWGASEKVDIQHWARFPPWRPFAKAAKRPDYRHSNFEQRDHIFMRWKECFLVPDHRVRDISGASFAGFYYICFNQLTGSISGLYFHQISEKYQQLELSHVPDRGNYYSYEFR
ncbi:vacuolar import and degradation protein-domain-containing protein [Limtongia smithiae]|uniref:vacuolar import and degradation protein-domain-containing protein n=1 Tax=Limtongia smithiae TaxID=1125753 RepID=UPI0034CD7CBA